MMQLYRFNLQIKSAFATLPKGDTLFGQLCWLIVRTFGENKLSELLEGYTDGRPFMIISDFLIENHIQLPPIPRWMIDQSESDIANRKVLKNLTMIDIAILQANLYRLDCTLLSQAKNKKDFVPTEEIQMRVKINRQTGTTGEGFDPFANVRLEYAPQSSVSLYIWLDTNKLTIDNLHTLIEQLGKTGFGKDATIGRGQFSVLSITPVQWNFTDCNAMISLSPSVLNDQNITEAFYEPFTRWGKHGDYLAHSGALWKNPIIMADSFACIVSEPKSFIGHGISGISNIMPATVHQGYAITIPVQFNKVDA